MKRQLQKRETLLKNIDRDIAKIVEIDRLNLANNLRTYGAPVKNLGRPSKFTREELSKLPELIERIKNESPIIANLEEQGHIKIIGGLYDVETGAVKFYI